MRTLITLGLLQCGLTAFVLFEVSGLRREERLVPDGPLTVAATTVSDARADAQSLRRIIREELAAWQLPTARIESAGSSSAGQQTFTPEEQQAQLEAVTRQFEQFRSQGFVSPIDMADFQAGLAKLDPATRRRVLSDLMQAMNAGEIRGQL
jgi:hypothetical protein